MNKRTTCMWFDHGQAREAAEFYASVFPDSKVGEGHASPVDNPSGKAGEELTVEFTVLGQAFVGLAERAMEAMLTMKKIDIARIQAARAGAKAGA